MAIVPALFMIAGCASLAPSQRTSTKSVSDTRALVTGSTGVRRINCPRLKVRDDTGTIGKDTGEQSYLVTIVHAAPQCTITDDTLSVKVRVEMQLKRGDGADTGIHRLPLRIAVTTAQGRVRYSHLAQVKLDLAAGQDRLVHERTGIMLVPRDNNRLAYLIHVGFDEGPQGDEEIVSGIAGAPLQALRPLPGRALERK